MPKNLLDMLKDIKIQDLNRVVISPQGIVSFKTTTNEPPFFFCENNEINQQLQDIKLKDLNRVVFDGNGNVRLEPKREEQPTRPKKQVKFKLNDVSNLDDVSYKEFSSEKDLTKQSTFSKSKEEQMSLLNEPDEHWLIGPHSPGKAIDVAQRLEQEVARTNNTQYYASMDSQQRILFREEFIRHNPEGRKNILKVQEENDLKRLLESFTSIINNPEYQAYATQHRSLALDVEKELKAREIYSFVQKQVQERRLPQGAFDNSRLLDFARGVANNNGVFSYARKFDNSPQDMLVGALYQQYASIQYINQPEPLIQQQQPVVARTNTTQYYASMDSQQRILFRKEFIRHNPEGRKNILKVQEENDLKRLLESFTSIINNPKYHDLATQHRGLALDVEKELKAREIYSFVQNNIKSSNLSLDSSRVDLNLMNYCRATVKFCVWGH